MSVQVFRYTPPPRPMKGWLRRSEQLALSFRICFCVFMMLMSRHEGDPTISHFASVGCDTFSKNIHFLTIPSSSLSSSVSRLFTEEMDPRMDVDPRNDFCESLRSRALSTSSPSVSATGAPHSPHVASSPRQGNLHTLHRRMPLGTTGGHTLTQ